jgi:hypothetical protein
MTEKARELRHFVASEGRVHPKNWHEFSKLLVKSHPDTPWPLILGGASASDMAKRVRLLNQIRHIEEDPRTLDLADHFLRGLPDRDWVKGQEPPSNRDLWGSEDVPPLLFLLVRG